MPIDFSWNATSTLVLHGHKQAKLRVFREWQNKPRELPLAYF